MASRPELVLQFAHYLERLAEQRGKGDVAVYAHVFSSLNGRPHQRLVDDRVFPFFRPYPGWPPLAGPCFMDLAESAAGNAPGPLLPVLPPPQEPG